jgi:DNA-binding CsgD family transcriptional regulator
VSLIGPHAATARELKARLEMERIGEPFLILRDGGEEQLLIALSDLPTRFTIGRSTACEIALPWDSQASRVHAEFERIGPGWALSDGGLSRNGSFVNGERLRERRRLADGDLVRVGRTSIVYREPAAAEGARGYTQTVLARDVPEAAELSPAQKAVLRALCRPFADTSSFLTPATNAQIAGELFLSLDAVKGHLRVLFSKFGVGDLPQNEKRLRLAERALQSGVITQADLNT